MLVVAEFGSKETLSIPEPSLVNPARSLLQANKFRIRKELFGYRLLYCQIRANGTPLTTRWLTPTLGAAVTLLQKKVEEKVDGGYKIISLYDQGEPHSIKPSTCKIFDFNVNYRSKEKQTYIETFQLRDNDFLDSLRKTLIYFAKMAEKIEEEHNILRVAMPIQWPSLNKTLRSSFIREKDILEIVFKMEDDGIIFLGDFVQLKKEQVDYYTRDHKITKKMIEYLEGRHLDTDMIVKNWRRPSTFGISM